MQESFKKDSESVLHKSPSMKIRGFILLKKNRAKAGGTTRELVPLWKEALFYWVRKEDCIC